MTYSDLLKHAAHHWRMFAYAASVCRFSLLVLIAGAALLFAGQGQDLLLSTAEDERVFVLLSSVAMWAFSIWLWTRTLLDIHFPSTPRHDAQLLAAYRRWTPRVLGLLPFACAALALLSAGDPASHEVLPMLLLGLVFALLVVFGQGVVRKTARIVLRTEPNIPIARTDAPRPTFRDSLWTGLGVWDHAALWLLAVGVVMYLWAMIDPLSMGRRFNALILLMAWGATLLPLGSLISYYANLWRLPFVTLLALLAIGSSTWNDNHAIRPLAGDAAPRRVTAGQALDAWAQAHCPAQDPARDCGPLIVVATAGGGIRAAYWTGAVLGHLEDQVASFHDRVFAISAVSGGALGASVYRALVAGADKPPCKNSVRECSTAILSQDFLAPLSASLLYRELQQRFIPIALLPDRAQTLETAWESAFESVTGSNTLGESFAAFGQAGQTPWPALFLNATWSENGRRSVASSVRIDQEPAFKLASDQLAQLGYDVRLSTAAHNSARFPFVSPAGSWREGRGDDRTAGKVVGRLQDSGLFENYGAVTALEILQLTEQRLGGRYTPVVVQISSDPALPADLAPSPKSPVNNIAYDVLTTLRTLLNTRASHGEEAAVRLMEWAQQRGSYLHFRMCDPAREGLAPPLGWALSRHATQTIRSYLVETPGDTAPSCRAQNLANVRQLCSLLGAKAGSCS